MKVRLFFQQLLSSRDNQTPCFARWSGAYALLSASGLTVWNVVWGKHGFDVQAYAFAMSAVIGATCAGVAVKARDEPDPAK